MKDFVQQALAKLNALWRGPARIWIIGAGAIALVVIGWMSFAGGGDEEPYRTAQVDRGRISRVVSATGALEPLVKVDVGSTVSGLVQTVEVDFNSQVTVGQVLARLDPSTFQQRVTQAQANVAQAQAQLGVAEADYQRYQRLQAAGFASDQLMLQQRANRDSARAVVSQQNAALASARIDLERSVIRSPINGVVVDRQIDPGQSVAASFQAPILFIIAQDLARLQANITVDEADIGEVAEGQPVRFTVDAFPDTDFDGRVSQVRQQGTSESGVVSYVVVVEADNPRRSLLPGMTANAEIVLEEQENVLRVPNAALRFRPGDPKIAARAQDLLAASGEGQRAGGQRREGGGAWAQTQGGQSGGQRGEGGQRGGGRAIAQLNEALELTEAQQAIAQAASQQAMAAAPQDRNERRAFMRRMRETIIAQLEPTLSAGQRELLAEMQAAGPGAQREVRRQAVVWVLRRGEPTPIQVEIGVADTGYAVLLGGELQEGDEVIVGGGPQAPASSNPMGGPGGPGGVRIRGA